MTGRNSPPGSWKRVWPAVQSMIHNRRLHPAIRSWFDEQKETRRTRRQIKRFRTAHKRSIIGEKDVKQAIRDNAADAAAALDLKIMKTAFPYAAEGTIVVEDPRSVANLADQLRAKGLSTKQSEGGIRVWQPRLMTDHWLAQEELAANIRTGPVPRDLSPIDAVVTWVDGSDPVWRAKMSNAKPIPELRLSANNSRFSARGQLRFMLRSIVDYTPWIRTVFLVTDSQRPDWLIERKNLVLVDHREILPSESLPTFSSHAIETAIHRIPELSETFIYFNDDTFVGRPLGQKFFFDTRGRPVFARAPIGPSSSDGDPVSLALSNAQILVDPGGQPLERLDHSPRPLLRSTIYATEERFGDAIARTRLNKFRSADDVSLLSQLHPHLLIRDLAALLIDRPETYINIASRWAPSQMRQILNHRQSSTFTLNDTETPSRKDHRIDRSIARFLSIYFPYPSPWEID